MKKKLFAFILAIGLISATSIFTMAASLDTRGGTYYCNTCKTYMPFDDCGGMCYFNNPYAPYHCRICRTTFDTNLRCYHGTGPKMVER